ncbi:MAG: hypothetical protein V1849_03095, partial [Chloroflexota bacterium]
SRVKPENDTRTIFIFRGAHVIGREGLLRPPQASWLAMIPNHPKLNVLKRFTIVVIREGYLSRMRRFPNLRLFMLN